MVTSSKQRGRGASRFFSTPGCPIIGSRSSSGGLLTVLAPLPHHPFMLQFFPSELPQLERMVRESWRWSPASTSLVTPAAQSSKQSAGPSDAHSSQSPGNYFQAGEYLRSLTSPLRCLASLFLHLARFWSSPL